MLFAVVAFALAVTGVHESRDPKAGSLDIAGILTLSLSVFCLAFYITQGPDLGFASPTGLAILGVSVASFIAFLVPRRSASDRCSIFRYSAIRRLFGRDRRLGRDEPQLLAFHDLSADLVPGRPWL